MNRHFFSQHTMVWSGHGVLTHKRYKRLELFYHTDHLYPFYTPFYFHFGVVYE